MAFSKSKAPVRILLVLLGGMAGGWFFWTLQSQVKWGLFGTAAGILLVHCMVEIIYHFDFKSFFTQNAAGAVPGSGNAVFAASVMTGMAMIPMCRLRRKLLLPAWIYPLIIRLPPICQE